MKKIILLILLLAFVPATAQTFLEEPAHDSADISSTYVSHYVQYTDGTYTRSFTVRYNKTHRIALWVAYPLNEGLIGTGSRGDGWHPDPAIPEKNQPILYKGFKYGSGYDRGHQIPSADRLDPEANEQTFQFTNATPQLHDFNGGIWAELEKVVRTWAKRSDTLYVVTGAIPGKETIADNNGRAVNIPSSYYKIVLRKNTDRNGNVHWSACAVHLRHEIVQVLTWRENLNYFRQCSVSVREMERITGEKFFPLLSWILPTETVNQIMSQEPSETTWWWK